MFQSDSVTIWLSTHGLDPTGREKIKSKPALLSWNVTDHTMTITMVDDKETPLSTIVSMDIQAMTKVLFSTTDCIIKVNEAFYIIQPRTKGHSVRSTVAFASSPIIAAATSEANMKLQQFGQYLRSVIPDRVAGGRMSIKTRIVIGLILGAVAIVGIVVFSLANR